ncbi:MAG TPA: hypothetical protein VNO21_14770 [Polyangiaceae bacterium]|nr:hypothetical protein [Polyangiaceae bacterium]
MVCRIGKVLGFAAAAALFSVVAPETSHAESAPTLANWTPLGTVLVDKSGCPSCPATFTSSARHRYFGLVSESLYPVTPSGQLDVTCSNGTRYNVFLRSSSRAGLFQVVPNSCIGFDVEEIKLTITSVALSAPDEDRTVALFVYGSFG